MDNMYKMELIRCRVSDEEYTWIECLLVAYRLKNPNTTCEYFVKTFHGIYICNMVLMKSGHWFEFDFKNKDCDILWKKKCKQNITYYYNEYINKESASIELFTKSNLIIEHIGADVLSVIKRLFVIYTFNRSPT